MVMIPSMAQGSVRKSSPLMATAAASSTTTTLLAKRRFHDQRSFATLVCSKGSLGRTGVTTGSKSKVRQSMQLPTQKKQHSLQVGDSSLANTMITKVWGCNSNTIIP